MYCYVPEDYDSTKAYPFLFGWHGAGMPGSNMRDMLYVVLGQSIDCIIVCPDANNLNGQPAQLLTNLINASYGYALDNYNIDPNKRVINGFSWGGSIAYQLGLLNPDMFDGIIGLAPAIGQFDQTMWNNIEATRMATILGDQDFNFSVVDALMKQIESRGGSLLYLVKPGVEHVDNEYFGSQEFIDDWVQCYNYVLGISDVEESHDEFSLLTISPNPCKDVLNIYSDVEISSEAVIGIYNLQGIGFQSMKKGLLSGKVAVDVSGLAQGVYFLKIQFDDKYIVRKFIKY